MEAERSAADEESGAWWERGDGGLCFFILITRALSRVPQFAIQHPCHLFYSPKA
jgi:hypothetical protein